MKYLNVDEEKHMTIAARIKRIHLSTTAITVGLITIVIALILVTLKIREVAYLILVSPVVFYLLCRPGLILRLTVNIFLFILILRFFPYGFYISPMKDVLVFLFVLNVLTVEYATAGNRGRLDMMWLWVLGYACYATLNTFLQAPGIASMIGLRGEFQYIIFGLAVSIYIRNSGKKTAMSLVNNLIYAATAVAVIGIFERVFLIGFPPYMALKALIMQEGFGQFTGRVMSTILNPNNLAFVLSCTISIALGLYLYTEDKKYRRVLLLQMCVQGTTLILAMSRTTYGALAAVIPIMLVFRAGRAMKLILIAVFAIVVVFVTFPTISERILSTTRQESLGRREGTWGETLERVSRSPALGYGIGSNVLEGDIRRVVTTDNYYLKILMDNGIVGLVFFTGLFLILILKSGMGLVIAENSFLKGLCYGNLTWLLLAGLGSITQPVWWLFPSNYLMWLLIGAMLGLLNREKLKVDSRATVLQQEI